MKLFLFLLFTVFPFQVFAACGSECITPPNCEKMGYRRDITCPESYILCPLDTNYKWCKQYTCSDGRYDASPKNALDGYKCTQVKYHGLNCYDCEFGICPDGYYNTQTCWNGSMYSYVSDSDNCDRIGYTDVLGDCSTYLVCPADKNKIKCIFK